MTSTIWNNIQHNPLSSQWVVDKVIEEFHKVPFAAAMTQIDDEIPPENPELACKRAIIQISEEDEIMDLNTIFQLGVHVGATELRFHIQEKTPLFTPGQS